MPRGHVGQKRTTQTLLNIRVLSDVRKDALRALANRTCSRTRAHPELAVLSPGARLDMRKQDWVASATVLPVAVSVNMPDYPLNAAFSLAQEGLS